MNIDNFKLPLAIEGETRAVIVFTYILMLDASTLLGASQEAGTRERQRKVLAPAYSSHQVPPGEGQVHPKRPLRP
jgi:hypothetical protein